MNKFPLSVLLVSAWLVACSPIAPEPVQPGCETVANVQGVCGFPAPEDIDVFPGGKFLLFSPVSSMQGGQLQTLYRFEVSTLKAEPVAYRRDDTATLWGDPNCQTAPGERFSPHGVHISRRADGDWQLLAVNHVRESVEMYQVLGDDQPELLWRGCAMAPPNSDINDVVALPQGGLLVTHMLEKGSMDVMEAMQSTENTGFIWRWRPGKGFDKLPGSDGIVPNGVEVSADGQSVYVTETGGQQLRKLDYATGEQLAVVKLGPADNLSWAEDGRLIATRVTGAMPADCFSAPGPCLAPFQVVALDPQNLALTVLHDQKGKPMGAASVAVWLDDYLYVGSFKGQQIMRVDMKGQDQ